MIRPIEMQMLLPRSESVGNTQQFENQRVVNENAFAANQVAKEVKQNSETVIRKNPNEFAEYKYDAKEEGNGTYQNPRKHKKQKEQEETDDRIDISFDSNANTKDNQPRINIQI